MDKKNVSKKLAKVITDLHDLGYKKRAWKVYSQAMGFKDKNEEKKIQNLGKITSEEAYRDMAETNNLRKEDNLLREEEDRIDNQFQEEEKSHVPRVLQLDQWHADALEDAISRNDAPTFDELWDDNEILAHLHGADVDTIKLVFGGHAKRLTDVPFNQEPQISYVWFVRGERGAPKKWKASYDTSD